jgi:hypothetical protein
MIEIGKLCFNSAHRDQAGPSKPKPTAVHQQKPPVDEALIYCGDGL